METQTYSPVDLSQILTVEQIEELRISSKRREWQPLIKLLQGMAQEAKFQLRSPKDWGDFNKRNGVLIGIERILEAIKSLNYTTEGEKEDDRNRIDSGAIRGSEEGGSGRVAGG